MDKIYSRRRIKLPKINVENRNNKKKKKVIKFAFIWIIAILTSASIIRNLGPVFDGACVQKAKSIGTIILNDESTKVIKDIDYNDLIKIEKDSSGNIKIVQSNVILINLLASDIASNVQEKLDNIAKSTISIPVGTILGTKLITGFGPGIKIKVIPAGSVITDFKSEFVSKGINQTMHRLYLDVRCEVKILTPSKTIGVEILNQVLLAENIIVGNVPESFYNLEGITQENTVDIIK